ncbi:hypothetical protein [Neosynechococcus sphagnicola]|uniref:hypothetical protein n=1 Tax=Neosynechococcus sphagnicola TaxID=1501145 RepID=UPI00308440EF
MQFSLFSRLRLQLTPWLVTLVVTGAIAWGMFTPVALATTAAAPAVTAVTAVPTQPSLATQAIGQGSFVAAAVDRIGTAVVRIDTEMTVTHSSPDPILDDPFFRRFFGEEMTPPLPPEKNGCGGRDRASLLTAPGSFLPIPMWSMALIRSPSP